MTVMVRMTMITNRLSQLEITGTSNGSPLFRKGRAFSCIASRMSFTPMKPQHGGQADAEEHKPIEEVSQQEEQLT